MAAILVAIAKIKDPTKLQEYSSAAAPTISAAGGSIVTRGKVKAMLAGSLEADSTLVAKFADVEAAKAWYQSPAYQALIPLRDQAMTATFLLLEEPS
jgi:uncharacterized protein (DUF1330 family)